MTERRTIKCPRCARTCRVAEASSVSGPECSGCGYRFEKTPTGPATNTSGSGESPRDDSTEVRSTGISVPDIHGLFENGLLENGGLVETGKTNLPENDGSPTGQRAARLPTLPPQRSLPADADEAVAEVVEPVVPVARFSSPAVSGTGSAEFSSEPGGTTPESFKSNPLNGANRRNIVLASVCSVLVSVVLAVLAFLFLLDYVNRPSHEEQAATAGYLELSPDRDESRDTSVGPRSGHENADTPASRVADDAPDSRATLPRETGSHPPPEFDEQNVEQNIVSTLTPRGNEARLSARLPAGRFVTQAMEPDSIDFSTNGVVYAAEGDSIAAYDSTTGEEIDRREHIDYVDRIQTVATSIDSRFLFAGGSSGVIKVWKLDSPGRLADHGIFSAHDSTITSIHPSADGKTIASGDRNGTIQVWDAESLEQVSRFLFLEHEATTFISEDANTVSASDGRSFFTLDRDDSLSRRTYQLDMTGPEVAFSTDGRLIAVARNRSIVIVDAGSSENVTKIEVDYSIASLEFSRDSRTLFGGSDGFVYQWNAKTGDEFRKYASPGTGMVKVISLSPDGTRLATIGDSEASTIGISEVRNPLSDDQVPITGPAASDIPAPVATELIESGIENLEPGLNDVEHLVAEFAGNGSAAISFAESGVLYAAGSSDTIRAYNWTDGTILDEKNDISWSLWPVIAVREGRLACAGNSGTIIQYDIDDAGNLEAPTTLPDHSGDRAVLLDFSPDGTVSVSAFNSGSFLFRDSDSDEIRFELEDFDGRSAAVLFRDDSIVLVTDGRVLTRVSLEHGSVESQSRIGSGADRVTFSAEGRFLACSTADTISILDVEQSNLPENITIEGVIHDSCFSPDGRYLFVARGGVGDAGEVVQWDIERARVAGTYAFGHDVPPVCIAVSKNGRFLAASGLQSDDPIRVYEIVTP